MPFMDGNLIAFALLMILVLGITASAIRVLSEYERGVVFTLGRFSGLKGPGIIILIPVIQQMVRVDLRTIVLDVPTQDVISHDNVSVKVNAIIYFRIVDPDKSVIQVQEYMEATSQLAQTTLRSMLGKHDLDEMLSEWGKLNRICKLSSTSRLTVGASRSGTLRSSTWASTRAWFARSPVRRRRSALAGHVSLMPKESSRRPRSSSRPPLSSARHPEPCNSDTSRLCTGSRANEAPRSSSLCR